MKPRLTAIVVLTLLLLGPGAAAQDITGQVYWNFSGLVTEGGSWEMRVTASGREFTPGDGLTIAVEFTVNSIGLAHNISRVNGIYTLVTGQRMFDGNGDTIGGSHAMASTILNGVGLPIEGESYGLPPTGSAVTSTTPSTRTS